MKMLKSQYPYISTCLFLRVNWSTVQLLSLLSMFNIKQVQCQEFQTYDIENFTFRLSVGCLSPTLLYLSFLFGHATRHVGSQFPDQGLNSDPLLWKHTPLTTGLPGNSLGCHFDFQPRTTTSHINNCKKIQYV